MKIFTREQLDVLTGEAAGSQRLRANENVHPLPGDPVQRFFNAMLPGTYVRPHRHVTPPRWELFLVLQGRIGVLLFDDHGCVVARHDLDAQQGAFGAEIDARRWHALVALEPSVAFEVKQGPYDPPTDKEFARWAPAEGDTGCEAMVAWYRDAQPGDCCTRR